MPVLHARGLATGARSVSRTRGELFYFDCGLLCEHVGRSICEYAGEICQRDREVKMRRAM